MNAARSYYDLLDALQQEGRSVVEPTGKCLVCVIRDEIEGMLIKVLVEGLTEPSMVEAYSASAGLCIPHLRLALCRAPNREAFDVLRNIAISAEDLMLTQLREIARKHDYRFSNEPAGEEWGAAHRAVHHVVGVRGISD